MNIDRRNFLSASAAAAAGLTMNGLASPTLAAETSGLRVGMIGVRARGKAHLDCLKKHVVAICDVDSQVLADRTKEHEGLFGGKIDTYTDYRKLMERDDIDAVSIATPQPYPLIDRHCSDSVRQARLC